MIKLEIDKILFRLREKLPETWTKYEERLRIESSRLDPIPAHQSICYGIEGIKDSNTIVLYNSKVCLPSPDPEKDFWKNWANREIFFPEFKELELEFINLFYNKYKYHFCPYCGKIPLIKYENDKKAKRRTFDLDHFYPKNTYQHLMYNFYNLVPVCKVCNQLKGTKNFSKKNEYYHPYFGWVKNLEIDESKNQDTEFYFSEDKK